MNILPYPKITTGKSNYRGQNLIFQGPNEPDHFQKNVDY